MPLLSLLVRLGLGLALSSAGAVPLQAAWRIDPDFRPNVHIEGLLPPIAAVQPDGRLIVNSGEARLMPDGSPDPSYRSLVRYDRILVSPTGQLVAGTGELIWLAADGRPTGATVASSVDVDTGSSMPWLREAGFLADGSLVVYGKFTALNGVPCPGFGRILADATVDPTFAPPGLAEIYGRPDPDSLAWSRTRAAVQSDGGVVIFAIHEAPISGEQTARLLRLRADGSVDAGFDGSGFADDLVWALAVDAQDRIYYVSSDALYSDAFWRHDADGGNPVLLEAGTTTTDLLPEPGGSVVAVTNYSGSPWQVSRWLEDGSRETLDVPASHQFIAVTDQHIHAQSRFGFYYRLLPDGSDDPELDLSGAEPARAGVWALAPAPGNKVVIAGNFHRVDDHEHYAVARLNADGSRDNTFAPAIVPPFKVETVAVQPDGRILVAGQQTSPTAPVRVGIMRYLPDGSLDTSFDAGLETPSDVHAIALMSDGRVLIAGGFASVHGVARKNIARLFPDGSLDPSFEDASGLSASGPILDLELLADNRVLASGYITVPPGVFDYWDVVQLNADGSLDPQFLPPETSGFSVTGAVVSGADGRIAFTTTHGSGSLRTRLVLVDSTGAEIFSREVGFGWLYYSTEAAILRDEGGTILSQTDRGREILERYFDNGDMDPSFAIELKGGRVNDIVRDGNGGLLVGGEFVGADGMAFSGAFRLVPDAPAPRLANISTRGHVGSGDDVLIAGFYVTGTVPQRVLLRGIAENLAGHLAGGLATDVRIAVYRNGDALPVHLSDNWGDPNRENLVYRTRVAGDRVGAFPLGIVPLPNGGEGSTDTAALLELPPGAYTVHLQAMSPGIGLIEAYDANGIGADRKVVNISTRGRVGTNDEKLIAGFVISEGTKRVLIRAVGPGIAGAVASALADPQLELVRQSDHAVLETNDNWGDNANAADVTAASLQVSGLQLEGGSADAALLVDLPPGGYTVIVSGVGDTTGIALVEVYEVE